MIEAPIEKDSNIWRQEWDRVLEVATQQSRGKGGVDYALAMLRDWCLEEKDARACLMFKRIMTGMMADGMIGTALRKDDTAYTFWRQSFEFMGEEKLADDIDKVRKEYELWKEPLNYKKQQVIEKFIENWEASFNKELEKRGIPIMDIEWGQAEAKVKSLDSF